MSIDPSLKSDKGSTRKDKSKSPTSPKKKKLKEKSSSKSPRRNLEEEKFPSSPRQRKIKVKELDPIEHRSSKYSRRLDEKSKRSKHSVKQTIADDSSQDSDSTYVKNYGKPASRKSESAKYKKKKSEMKSQVDKYSRSPSKLVVDPMTSLDGRRKKRAGYLDSRMSGTHRDNGSSFLPKINSHRLSQDGRVV